MSILYKKVWRLLNPLDKKSAKKVYPVITYKYGVAMDLKQIAKKISRLSGVSEGVVNSERFSHGVERRVAFGAVGKY